ncbi:MAG TPA: hypothetical protein VFN23_13350, partial [Ktedonobacteraceae bacterium]|nr:hypothetical protein [Ktedonobacteraceae bacterium]
MTTHNNHPEDRDVTVSGAEHEPASDTLSTPTSPDQATHHEKDAAVNEEQKISAGESKTDDVEASPQANSASSFDKTAEDTSHQSADVSSVGDTENVQSDTPSQALASEDDETPTQKSPAIEPQNASIAAAETSEADIRRQAEVSVEPEPPVLSDGLHIPETDEPETPEAEAKAEEEAENVLLKTVEHEPQPAQDPMPEANMVDQSYTPTMSEQQEIRPFTAFIEEFRQVEEARGFS